LIDEELQSSTSNYAGAIYISSSTNGVSSTRNIFRNCYTGAVGGVYTLIRTSMTDSNTEYYDNAAVSAGVIKCDACALTITDSNFYNNRAGDGGVFLFDN
jgi:hypothetical protein